MRFSVFVPLGDGPFPARIEIRGEVILSKRGFASLQQREETSSEGTFRNARNTVAGTLKLLDPRIVKRRPLDFLAFAVGHVEGCAFATHTDLRRQLAAWGFTVAEPAATAADLAALEFLAKWYWNSVLNTGFARNCGNCRVLRPDHAGCICAPLCSSMRGSPGQYNETSTTAESSALDSPVLPRWTHAARDVASFRGQSSSRSFRDRLPRMP